MNAAAPPEGYGLTDDIPKPGDLVFMDGKYQPIPEYYTRLPNSTLVARRIEPKDEPTKTQVGGSHYKGMSIQPVEFITANGLGFCEGNVIKYVCRHASKGGKQDLEKARHYIDLLISQKYP